MEPGPGHDPGPIAAAGPTKTCLRCDWEGTTPGEACPACRTRLYVTPARRPSAGSTSTRSAPLPRRPVWRSAVGTGSSPATTDRAAAPGPLVAPQPAVGGDDDRRRAGPWLVLAGLVVIVAAGLRGPDEEPPTVAASPARSSGDAVRTAAAFLAAYGDLDAERALGHLADDAEISLLLRSVGATGVEGTPEEFRLYVSMLEAWRYRHRVESCEERGVTAEGILVRCDFSYDFLGSHRLGLGPYGGSAFDLRIRGDRVAHALKIWSFDRFSREMWEPFAAWVADAHPNDVGYMYSDPTRRGVRLDEGSIRRWDRHTRTYIRVRLRASNGSS